MAIDRDGKVPFSEASEDGNGGSHAWLVHIHLLEAALQGRVLLNVLAVLIQSGGPNAAQLPSAQHGLQQIAWPRQTSVRMSQSTDDFVYFGAV